MGTERSSAVGPLIGGKLTESSSNEQIEILNPSSGQRVLSIPVGSADDVDRAVLSARSAFDEGGWRDTPPSFKKAILHRFAELIRAEAAQLDALDAEEMGKPISVTFGNANAACQLLHFHAESVDKLTGDVFTSDKTTLIAQRRVPRGVVAAIVPWNFPTINAALKIAPALATGNTVVLKPSELASRSSVRLAQLALNAGLPTGVFNVVPGRGTTVGRMLAEHMDVDMIAFTGSTAVGKLMHQYAGQSNLKPVLAECGGKCPQIVFGDAHDLDAVADGIAYSILTNQGQWCSAGSRVIVQEQVEAELIDKIIQRFHKIKVGDPCDSGVTFGPLVTSQHCEKVERYIAAGQAQGGELVEGGTRLLPDSGGNFISPALLRNVRPDMSISQDEIFGPVLSVTAFRDETNAIQLANSSIYGLMATAWTTSMATGMRLSREIRSGIVMVNAATPSGEGSQAISAEPYGQSGTGTELGLGGMESYLRRQVAWFNHG